MPVSLSISHEKRRVVAVVEGEAGLVDGLKAIAQIFAAGAMPYAKLIDLTFARMEDTAGSIRKLSSATASFNKGRKPGPLAIVATNELCREMVEIFDAHVGADRPLKMFSTTAEAEAWLDGLSRQPDNRLAG